MTNSSLPSTLPVSTPGIVLSLPLQINYLAVHIIFTDDDTKEMDPTLTTHVLTPGQGQRQQSGGSDNYIHCMYVAQVVSGNSYIAPLAAYLLGSFW